MNRLSAWNWHGLTSIELHLIFARRKLLGECRHSGILISQHFGKNCDHKSISLQDFVNLIIKLFTDARCTGAKMSQKWSLEFWIMINNRTLPIRCQSDTSITFFRLSSLHSGHLVEIFYHSRESFSQFRWPDHYVTMKNESCWVMCNLLHVKRPGYALKNLRNEL